MTNVAQPRQGVEFYWNGRRLAAEAGDSVAAALRRNGILTIARSRKLHRPLGHSGSFVAGVLARVDGRPNVRLDQEPCRPGMRVSTQNVWPSAGFDLLAAARLLPPRWVYGGFEHGRLAPSGGRAYAVWERLMANLAGVAAPPDESLPVAVRPAQRIEVDVLVIGGGPAARQAANAAAAAGREVALVTRGATPGRFSAALGVALAPLSPAVRLFCGMDLFGCYRLVGVADLHRKCGVRSHLVSESELASLLPALNRQRVAGALHLPDGGVAPHHAAMKGLRAACQRRGVDIRYRTPVTGFERTGEGISAVMVGDHRIDADTVVVAAGAHNGEIARRIGVPLDGYSMRIEAMALEPTRPLIKPGIALIDSLAYFHQTSRGEIVGGVEVPERPRMSLRTDVPVMAWMAKVYLDLFPQLAELRILRHWAGMLHVSSDFAPLLGPHPALRDLWFSAGWSYGFAGAPGAGLLLAKAIATGEIDPRMRPFALDRFERGQPIAEASIVLAKN